MEKKTSASQLKATTKYQSDEVDPVTFQAPRVLLSNNCTSKLLLRGKISMHNQV